jgi:hypothetical protein
MRCDSFGLLLSSALAVCAWRLFSSVATLLGFQLAYLDLTRSSHIFVHARFNPLPFAYNDSSSSKFSPAQLDILPHKVLESRQLSKFPKS